MNTTPELHLAKYRKYMDEVRNVLVIFGNIEEVLVSQYLYEQRHGLSSDATSDIQHRLMNACALAATSLSDRESWGWTLTLPGADEGYFVGVEPEGMLCIQKKPADPELKKVYLQRQKNDEKLMQSHFEPASDCPVKTVTQYFNEVVQTKTRIVVRDKDGILIQALPDADFEGIDGMGDDDLFRLYTEKLAREELKPLQEFLIFYECRCDEKMIFSMVDNLPKHQKDELFANQTAISIECPRCGRSYTATRNDVKN